MIAVIVDDEDDIVFLMETTTGISKDEIDRVIEKALNDATAQNPSEWNYDDVRITLESQGWKLLTDFTVWKE